MLYLMHVQLCRGTAIRKAPLQLLRLVRLVKLYLIADTYVLRWSCEKDSIQLARRILVLVQMVC